MMFNGIISKNRYLLNREVQQNNYLRKFDWLIKSNEIACSNWNDLGFLPIL